MKHAQSIILLLVLVACSSSKTQTWTSLFDGQTLNGWKGDPAIWRVENGYISGKAERLESNTFLIYSRSFADFVLEAEVMLLEADSSFPNSGIQFRSKEVGQYVVQGYQVDLGQIYWGSLYDEGTGPMAETTPQALESVHLNGWNKVVIRAKGQSISVTINGAQAAQYENATVPEGVIALQYHAPGENFEIRFKNLRLRELE